MTLPGRRECERVGHEWRIFTTSESDFQCARCGQLGRNVRRYNHHTGRTEWTVRANTRR